MERFALSTGWQARQESTSNGLIAHLGWRDVRVPGVIPADLLRDVGPPEPTSTADVQSENRAQGTIWRYRCTFRLPAALASSPHLDLVCEGLDTIATLWLNGTPIATSTNMFVPLRVAIQSLLQDGENVLECSFQPPLEYGREQETVYGSYPAWLTDPARTHVRKAQYHFGWDWAPEFLTLGPWRPIVIEGYTRRLADVFASAQLAHDHHEAVVSLSVATTGSASSAHRLAVVVHDPDGTCCFTQTFSAAADTMAIPISLPEPRLWWPHTMGTPALYTLSLELLDDTAILAHHGQRIGIRTIEVIQNPVDDEPGTTFYFKINGIPCFCGGANWVPVDLALAPLDQERYRTLLTFAREAHMVMLRVWGGGIYEDDLFYRLCDEMGIIVWQDFMFSCALYPAYAAFLENVTAEIKAALIRLRNHPSIVLWCGNNEDYMVAESNHRHMLPQPLIVQGITLPARVIYEEIAPQLCAEYAPTQPYWPGSPSGEGPCNATTSGDCHVWDVWGANGRSYWEYPAFRGRFISEFGMQSAANRATIEQAAPEYLTDAATPVYSFHNTELRGTQPFDRYIDENYASPTDLDANAMIYATQLLQAEGMTAALRGWRRYWGERAQYTVGGALVWQLNDCWPATSWALIDASLTPKLAYYAVQRELAPITIGCSPPTDADVTWWIANSTLTAQTGTLVLRCWSHSGRLLAEHHATFEMAANDVTDGLSWPWASTVAQTVQAQLFIDEVCITTSANWSVPMKVLQLGDPVYEVHPIDATTLAVTVARPAKGVVVADAVGTFFDTNCCDVFPGVPQLFISQTPYQPPISCYSLFDVQSSQTATKTRGE